MKFSYDNNFNIIRIIAALQVVVEHSIVHLKINCPVLQRALSYIPGVPVFFTVSGFLIFASFDRNNNLISYLKNRSLRIFPALWMALIVTLGLFILFQVISFYDLQRKDLLLWIGAQLTFFQFYTPHILRSWGVGTPNGSLWTITVEYQFYLLLPFIYFLFKKTDKKWWIIYIAFFALSILINIYFSGVSDDYMIKKLASVSLFPYLYNFLIGCLIYICWDKYKFLFENKFFYWLSFYLGFIVIFSVWLKLYMPSYWPNFFGFIGNIILALLTISFAFTKKDLSKKILNRNDISYGIYIYHMLVVNCFVQLGLIGRFYYMVDVILITLILGILSWRIVEKRALLLKDSSFKKIATTI